MPEQRTVYGSGVRLTFFFLLCVLSLSLPGKVVSGDGIICEATDQTVKLHVIDAAGNTEQYFKGILCGSTTATCTGLTVQQLTSAAGSQVGTGTVTLIEMVNFPTALEASLTYTADVRAQFLLASGQTVSQGNSNAGVSASAIYLLNSLYSIPLFMASPPDPYSVELQLIPSCPASTGYWAFALIGVLPVALLLFRSPWSSLQYSMPPPMQGAYQHNLLPPQQQAALENPGFYPSAAHSHYDAGGEANDENDPNHVGQYVVLEDGKTYFEEHRKDPITGDEKIVYINPETKEEYYYE